jgi:hypothetical protein
MTVTRSAKISVLATTCVLATTSLTGCNMNRMVANSTAGLIEEGAPALDAFWDWDLAGYGIPGGIMQLETFLHIAPDNEVLALNLAKAYLGYAQGWVENDYEIAFAAGDFDKSDRLRQRARLLYLRARNLALRCMRNRDDGIDEALRNPDQTVLAKYLADNYTSAEDVAPLFWAGLAWGSAINMSLDQPELIADLPQVKPLIERARELDDMYFNGGAYLALGTLEASFPPALGGDPEKGKKWFEQGLAKTGRKNHMMHVNYARIYAVNAQNRDLFYKLLTEVIEAGDMGGSVRLSNKIARIRAARYLAQGKEFF